jgi:hypothetical protein
MNTLIISVRPAWYIPTIFLTIGIALGLCWYSVRGALTPPTAGVLGSFALHTYCLSGCLSLALLRQPVLLVMSLAMMALTLYLHRTIARRWISKAWIDGQ